MISVRLFGHCWLHFDHGWQQVLEELELFALPVDCRWVCRDWTDFH